MEFERPVEVQTDGCGDKESWREGGWPGQEELLLTLAPAK